MYRLGADTTYLDVAKETKIFSRIKLMAKLIAVKLTISSIKNHMDFQSDALCMYSKILPRNIPIKTTNPD